MKNLVVGASGLHSPVTTTSGCRVWLGAAARYPSRINSFPPPFDPCIPPYPVPSRAVSLKSRMLSLDGQMDYYVRTPSCKAAKSKHIDFIDDVAYSREQVRGARPGCFGLTGCFAFFGVPSPGRASWGGAQRRCRGKLRSSCALFSGGSLRGILGAASFFWSGLSPWFMYPACRF